MENILSGETLVKPEYLEDCIDLGNPYSSKYIAITCSGMRSGKVTHHIVPVYFFKKALGLKKVRIKPSKKGKGTPDMKPENLSRISPVQHLIAHYYLHKCSVAELQRQADRAFMTMFNISGKRLLLEDENEYSCMYNEILADFNEMVKVYGNNFFSFHRGTKEDDDLSLVNTDEFPRISYYLIKKSATNRPHPTYCARVYQGGKEASVGLYHDESLSRIWVERAKRIYDIALDHYLENGFVPDYIKDNVVTADNLKTIYTKLLPVPLGSDIPDMHYSVMKDPKYGYVLVFRENGKKSRRILHINSAVKARRILARVQRVYDEAASLELRGLPVPQELRDLILTRGSGKIEDYMQPGNIGLINFLTGEQSLAPIYKTFGKKSKQVMHVVDEWETDMRSRGLKDRTIYQFTRVARKFIDNSLMIDSLSELVIQNVIDKIKESTVNWYRNIEKIRLFIKFAADKYSLPASLIAKCDIARGDTCPGKPSNGFTSSAA